MHTKVHAVNPRNLLWLLLLAPGCTHDAGADADATPRNHDQGRAESPDGAAPGPGGPWDALQWRRQRMLDENATIPEGAWTRARAQRAANIAHWDAQDDGGIGPFTWTERGPGNIGGRCRSIYIHPTITSRIFVGSVGGGVWRSTDSGANWTPLGQSMGNLSIGCLASHPSAPNTIFAGTGEGYGNTDAIRGEGIWRTTDGGDTWAQLPSTVNFVNTSRIAISPTNAAVLLASTTGGIRRSTDNGVTWTTVRTGGSQQVLFDPTDGNKAVANSDTRIVYSTDGGATWTLAAGSMPSTDRVELSYAPANPNWVFANIVRRNTTVTPNTFTVEIWRSTDGGANWSQRTTAANSISDGRQWWYDNCIWVDPTNSNNLLVGGVRVWRSTDGGLTFTAISPGGMNKSEPHSDVHFFAHDPGYNGTTNRRVYVATDGSIYRADNILTATSSSGWVRRDAGLNCIQYYGIDGIASGTLVGGTQDNGTHKLVTGSATATLVQGTADGTYAFIDAADPNYIYGAIQYLGLFRSTDGGLTETAISTGLTQVGQGNAPFVAPFVLAPSNGNILYAGATDVWRSSNAKAATPTWTSIRTSTTTASVSAVSVSPVSADIVWVGGSSGFVYRTSNGTAATPTWTTVDDTGVTGPLPNRFVTDIQVDPTNASRVVVTFGGFNSNNVWATTNGGTTWASISGAGTTALPTAPVYAVAIHPTLSGRFYVATEVGVFATADGGTTWATSNDGPNDAAAYDIAFLKGSTTLAVGTHGRGLWTTPIREPGVTSLGGACFGSAGRPALQATPARIGFTTTLTGSNLLPGQPAWLVQGSSSTTWLGNALPFELTPLGAPGCFLTVSADIVRDISVTASGTFTSTLPVAANPALLGRNLHLQVFGHDPTINTWGKVTSNGVRLTIGQ